MISRREFLGIAAKTGIVLGTGLGLSRESYSEDRAVEYALKEDIPAGEYFGGLPDSRMISNPVYFVYDAIFYETKEGKELKTGKISEGTGKYWILTDGASKKVKNAAERWIKDNSEPLFKGPNGLENYVKIPEGKKVEEIFRDVTNEVGKLVIE